MWRSFLFNSLSCIRRLVLCSLKASKSCKRLTRENMLMFSALCRTLPVLHFWIFLIPTNLFKLLVFIHVVIKGRLERLHLNICNNSFCFPFKPEARSGTNKVGTTHDTLRPSDAQFTCPLLQPVLVSLLSISSPSAEFLFASPIFRSHLKCIN